MPKPISALRESGLDWVPALVRLGCRYAAESDAVVAAVTSNTTTRTLLPPAERHSEEMDQLRRWETDLNRTAERARMSTATLFALQGRAAERDRMAAESKMILKCVFLC